METPKSILINEIVRMIERFKILILELENLIIKQETEGLSVKDYKRILFLVDQVTIGWTMVTRDVNNLMKLERGDANE